MRPLEIAVLGSHLMAVGWLYVQPGNGRLLWVVPLLPPLLILVHLLLEKPRWQMGPAYLQTSLLVLLVSSGRWMAWAGQGWLVVLGAAHFVWAALLPYILSVPRLPRPGGPYGVGTRTFYLVDGARQDIFSPDDAARELMVQVWYPARRQKRGRRAPFVADFKVGGPAIARRFGFPTFVLRHLGLVRTHSFVAAPLAEATRPFPVLLFSHGYLGLRSQNTWQMEALASHGYVVVAPNHTYGAICTVFPDGRIIFGMTAPPEELSLEGSGWLGMQQWAEDLSFVLDQAAGWAADPAHLFYGRLDLSRVGCLGHSMGGGTAVQFAAQDARCRALLLLDPWLRPLPEAVRAGVSHIPMLAMMSIGEFGQVNGAVAAQMAATRTLADAPAWALRIAGSGHYDYSDLPLLSPLARLLGAKGPINGRLVAEIINAYTLTFFDASLRERPWALLRGEKRYPEVHYLSEPDPD